MSEYVALLPDVACPLSGRTQPLISTGLAILTKAGERPTAPRLNLSTTCNRGEDIKIRSRGLNSRNRSPFVQVKFKEERQAQGRRRGPIEVTRAYRVGCGSRAHPNGSCQDAAARGRRPPSKHGAKAKRGTVRPGETSNGACESAARMTLACRALRQWRVRRGPLPCEPVFVIGLVLAASARLKAAILSPSALVIVALFSLSAEACLDIILFKSSGTSTS